MSSIASSDCENEPAIPWQVELNIFIFIIINYYYLSSILIIMLRSARTSCRTFDVSVPSTRPAAIFPEFIDKL